MKTNKTIERSVIDEKTGKSRPKTIHDYSGEELDQLIREDPEYESNLWSDAEVEAINNPDNHDKAH